MWLLRVNKREKGPAVCSSLSGDEERIKTLLAGDAKAIASGLNWLDQHYRHRIAGFVRRRCRTLSPDELAEVWQETLLSLYRMIASGNFTPDGALEGLLRILAMRRGQDRLRRNATWTRPITVQLQQLQEPQLIEKWLGLTALQRQELVELICESIDRLPPRQHTVWRVYVAHYPESSQLDYLTEEVRKATAEQQVQQNLEIQDNSADLPSKKAVSGALYAGRKKIREDLRRKGYDL